MDGMTDIVMSGYHGKSRMIKNSEKGGANPGGESAAVGKGNGSQHIHLSDIDSTRCGVGMVCESDGCRGGESEIWL